MNNPSDKKPEFSSAPLLQKGGLSYELSRVILLVLGVVTLWQLSHQIVEILMMFAMVFLLAIILNSVVVALEKRGVRRGLAVGLIMLSFISAVVLGGFLIVPPALEQGNQLVAKAPEYWQKIREQASQLEKRYPALKQILPPLDASKTERGGVQSSKSSFERSVTQAVNDSANSAQETDKTDNETDQNKASSDTENVTPEGTPDSTNSANTTSEEAPIPPDANSDTSKDENAAPDEKTPAAKSDSASETATDKSAGENSEKSNGDNKADSDGDKQTGTSKTVTNRVTTENISTPQREEKSAAKPAAPLGGLLKQDALWGYAKSAVAITANIAGGLFVFVLGFLLLMFCLANPQDLVSGLLSVTPEAHQEPARRSLARIFRQMTGWARATVMNGTITGIMTGVGLTLVGVQPALVFAICAFFGEFVPSVGPLVAAAPALFVAFSMGTGKGMAALGVILFVQGVASNAINPLLMGREMKLHPVTITFFALMMAKLFGVAGAIMAVPAAAICKILIEEFYLFPRGVNESLMQEKARGIVMNESGVEEPDADKEKKDKNSESKPSDAEPAD